MGLPRKDFRPDKMPEIDGQHRYVTCWLDGDDIFTSAQRRVYRDANNVRQRQYNRRLIREALRGEE